MSKVVRSACRQMAKGVALLMIIIGAVVTDRLVIRLSNGDQFAATTWRAELPPGLLTPEEKHRARRHRLKANNWQDGKPVLPNLLLIGAPKAGSTVLEKWLFQNGICGASVEEGEPAWYRNEPHFFDNDQRYGQGKEFYKQRYAHCFTAERKVKFRLDATPSTLMHPRRVYETYQSIQNPHKLKIVLVVREPIAREQSHYEHQVSLYQRNPDPKQWYGSVVHRRTGKIKTFPEYVDTVTIPCLQSDGSKPCSSSISHYAQHLKPWFELFDPTQLLVINYDTDILETSLAKQRIQTFLDSAAWTPRENTESFDQWSYNIPCSVAAKLAPLLEPWNEELHRLLAQHPRPAVEEQPFPRFRVACQPDSFGSYMTALNEIH